MSMITGMIRILYAGPLVSIQDAGRFGALGFGIAASGPMDRSAFAKAGQLVVTAGQSALESAGGRLVFELDGGPVMAGFSGGEFALKINDEARQWDCAYDLQAGDVVEITPGEAGIYAYVRFSMEMDVPKVVGSCATNTIARLGGMNGGLLAIGDEIKLVPAQTGMTPAPRPGIVANMRGHDDDAPIRFIWGIHADLFTPEVRHNFVCQQFVVSPHLDRMGVRLSDPNGVFVRHKILSLVSDAVVPGDMQILGDGSAIVLMRDHQPTGGYPRIATLVTPDLNRFAQLRPGTSLRFLPVSVDHAQQILKEARKDDFH